MRDLQPSDVVQRPVQVAGLDGIQAAVLYFLDSAQVPGNASLPLGGLSMAYDWDKGRARRTRLIKLASVWALTASALSVRRRDDTQGKKADNLSYGNIITVYTGDDESVTALTDDGMEELEQMLSHARRSPDEWNDFLDSFVDDKQLVARIKAKSPR
jgi:hypothetical protein